MQSFDNSQQNFDGQRYNEGQNFEGSQFNSGIKKKEKRNQRRIKGRKEAIKNERIF